LTTFGRYEAVVLGSAVYTGRWLQPAKELVQRFGGALAGRPVWLFSSGPVGDPSRKLVQRMGADPVDLPDILERTQARDHRIFAGKLQRTNLSFPVNGHLEVPAGGQRKSPRLALSLLRGRCSGAEP
jgi:menaquinone-dependent protoporphyrinogen oxidase